MKVYIVVGEDHPERWIEAVYLSEQLAGAHADSNRELLYVETWTVNTNEGPELEDVSQVVSQFQMLYQCRVNK